MIPRISRGFAVLLLCSLFLPALAEQPTARPVAGWIASGVIYEVNTRTFSSAGNFKGVEQKLDELKNLGVTILWLMPIHPSARSRKREPSEARTQCRITTPSILLMAPKTT